MPTCAPCAHARAQALDACGVGDGTIYELVLRHELQHTETMRQTMALAGLLPTDEPRLGSLTGGHALAGALHVGGRAGEWVDVPAGPFEMGAGAEGFAYDNERPRHTVELQTFQIARRPVSNASWLRFCEGGGYERREWWSEEGWAWKLQQDITHDPSVATGHPERRSVTSAGSRRTRTPKPASARLPSEAEWEKAAGQARLTGWVRSGSGRAATSTATRDSWRTPTGSTRKCSSEATTACCAAARGQHTPVWDGHVPQLGSPIRSQIFAGLRLARES